MGLWYKGCLLPAYLCSTVLLQMPLSTADHNLPCLPASEPQEPARKRQKSSRGMSLSELLPAPKIAATGSGRRLDVLGSGAASGSGRKYDSDDDEIVPGTEDRSGMVDLRPGGCCEYAAGVARGARKRGGRLLGSWLGPGCGC